MLIFFDETFRDSLSRQGTSFGALCGIAIAEKDLHRIATDVFQLKLKHFGSEFARDGEIKGKELLKNYVFRIQQNGGVSKNLRFATDLLHYLKAKHLTVFGCICFEKKLQKFRCEDMSAMDVSFRFLFQRIDMFMKIKYPERLAKLVFDDRDYGINQKNAHAITNFFQRSSLGLSFTSIIQTPFFAISQSQNVGLQLADFVTTIIGLRFASHPEIHPFWHLLRDTFFSYQAGPNFWVNSIKVMRVMTVSREKEAALDGPTARGRDK
ncbi:MAG: DUF3800 domain-containing protein [Verrucomicrobiota bacterium]|nr:DUF3800 domain-containing protein [Verrucomicrobiota bacterium]